MVSRSLVLPLIAVLSLGISLLCNDGYAQNAQPALSKKTKKEPVRKTDVKKTSSKTDEPSQKTTDETQNKEQEKREQAVTIGTILIMGVIILGIFLLSVILVWGRRTRRIVKSKGPKQTVIDPLWYLKSRKNEESVSPSDGQNDSDRYDSTQS